METKNISEELDKKLILRDYRKLLRYSQSVISKHDLVLVKKDFSIPNYSNIFVIGDLARFQDSKNEFIPGVAPAAMQAGEYVAKLIKNRVNGDKSFKEFEYKDKGNLAVIGRNRAVADLGFYKAQGFVAWLLWLFVHICFLIGFDNKVSVLIKWALNYFNQDKGTRLIFVK